MAASSRQPDAPLERCLVREGTLVRFFPGSPPAGPALSRAQACRSRRGSSEEVVRFKTRPTLAFLPGPVLDLERSAGPDEPAEMTVAALSLTGPTGAMPYCYTELLIECAQDYDDTLASFLDLFHHRLVSLFYRAWERSRPACVLERAWDNQSPSKNGSPGNPSPFSDHLFALIGLGLAPLRGRHDFPDEALLYYVGLFAAAPPLGDCAGGDAARVLCPADRSHPVRRAQAQAGSADRTTLGHVGPNNRLGVDTIMGDRITDVAGKFRLRVGPLSITRIPIAITRRPVFRRLVQMTRLFVDTGLIFDVQLVLEGEGRARLCVGGCTPGRRKAGPRHLDAQAWTSSKTLKTSGARIRTIYCDSK